MTATATYTVELTEDQIRLLARLADAEASALDHGVFVDQYADAIGFRYHVAGQLKAALEGEARDSLDCVMVDALSHNGFDAEKAAEIAARPELRAVAESQLRAILPRVR